MRLQMDCCPDFCWAAASNTLNIHGEMEQMVARLAHIQEVAGSNPVLATSRSFNHFNQKKRKDVIVWVCVLFSRACTLQVWSPPE